MSKIPYIKHGVLNGTETYKLFEIAKKNNFALPAINCSSIDVINASLEAAKISNSPIIIQFSYRGSIFIAGMGISSKQQQHLAFVGTISAAKHVHNVAKYYKIPIILSTDHCTKKNLVWINKLIDYSKKYYIRHKKSLFSIHMIDLSEETIKENIKVSMKYLYLMSKLNTMLEIEIGNIQDEKSIIKNKDSLCKGYTNKEDVIYAYRKLIDIDKKFIIAVSFGNTHGVYKRKIKLFPKEIHILQKHVSNIFNIPYKSLNLVFHGSSGVSYKDIKDSISYGVVKINIDTDVQWSFWKGLLKYYKTNKKFLNHQINLVESCKSNKNFYSYRSWIRSSQISLIHYLIKSFKKFNSLNSLKYINLK